MAMSDVIAQIDAEIAKLQQAKTLLSGLSVTTAAPSVKSGRGRPKGSKNATKAVATKAPGKKAARKLSPEGRKAISEAMKRRHEERRKQAGK